MLEGDIAPETNTQKYFSENIQVRHGGGGLKFGHQACLTEKKKSPPTKNNVFKLNCEITS